MKTIKFKSLWYPIIVHGTILLDMLMQLNNILNGNLIIPLIHLGLSMIIMSCIWLSTRKMATVIIKIWAAIIMVAGSLGFVSDLILLLLDSEGLEIQYLRVFTHVFNISIGIIIYTNWDKNIE